MSVLRPGTSQQNYKLEQNESIYWMKDLKMLTSPEEAYLLPLAMIALIDMNAFFAQCEQVRLGKKLEDPVVCCQWKSLIAVSYAARKFGITRLDPLNLALQKCPNLVVGHAAVFKKGESFWRYLDGLPDQALHKVSLDPYRRELRKVFRILQSQCDLVEKASVDECYLDLGRLVYNKLTDLFPFLKTLDAKERLPPIPKELPKDLLWEGIFVQSDTETLQFNGTELTSTTGKDQGTIIVNDWDDICYIIGSQYLYSIRQKVFEELKYTTSGGLATTKTVAKLAAGFIKPDQQTIIRPKAIYSFLRNFELTDITSMGGMIGQDILRKLVVPPGVNSTSFIRKEYSLEQLKQEYPNDHGLATRIYEFCRGSHQQRLKLRTAVKSMMSRKNFLSKYPVNTVGDTFDWIKVFVGDLYGRLVELDDESMNLSLLQSNPGERASISRPRTVAVHWTTSKWEKVSKQTKFPVMRDLVKLRATLEVVYFKLLCQILENNKDSDSEVKYTELSPDDPHLFQLPIPLLANLSVVIGNFVKTTDANLIDSYGQSSKEAELEKDLIARQFKEIAQPKQVEPPEAVKPPKVLRNSSYLKKVFADFEKENEESKSKCPEPSIEVKTRLIFKEDKDYVNKMFKDYQDDRLVHEAMHKITTSKATKSKGKQELIKRVKSRSISPSLEDDFLKELMQLQRCTQCNITVEDVFEHRDFHVALELSTKLNPSNSNERKKKKISQNQAKLPF